MEILVLSVLIVLQNVQFCSTSPAAAVKGLQPRQLTLTRTQDGGYQAAFSLSQAFKNQATEGTIAATRVLNIGPNGSSSSGGQSANIKGNQPGLFFDYSMSNAQAEAENRYGKAEANSNAVADIVKTPWTSSSNADTKTYANVDRFNQPFNSPLYNRNRYF